MLRQLKGWIPSDLADLSPQDRTNNHPLLSHYYLIKGKNIRTSKAPKMNEYDLMISNVKDKRLGYSGHGVEIFLRDITKEFCLGFSLPSGNHTLSRFEELDRITTPTDLNTLLTKLSKIHYCNGVISSTQQANSLDFLSIHERMLSWGKCKSSLKHEGGLFHGKCLRILMNIPAPKRGFAANFRCENCSIFRKTISNWHEREQKKISAKQKTEFTEELALNEEDQHEADVIVEECATLLTDIDPDHPMLKSSNTYGAADLFAEQMKLHEGDKLQKRRRYSRGFLNFCVLLKQICGRERYKRIRSMNLMALPDMRSVDVFFGAAKYHDSPDTDGLKRNWQQYIEMNNLSAEQSKQGMNGWISVDEVDVKNQASWKGSSLIGAVRGCTDTAISTSKPVSQLASSAMLFVWRSALFTEFRYPLCVFGVESNMGHTDIIQHWGSVLVHFTSSLDFKPLFLVSDGLKGSKEARKKIEQLYGVSYYPDPPHLFKRIWRRTVSNSSEPIWTHTGLVSRVPLEIAVYRSDQILSTAPRLSDSCLNPSSTEAMSVRLAAQLFSKRTLELLRTIDHEDTAATIQFISIMIEWWSVVSDCFKETQQSFDLKLEKLQKVKDYFLELKEKGDFAKADHKKNYSKEKDDFIGIRSLLPEQVNEIIYSCDFFLSGIGHSIVTSSIHLDGHICLNKFTQDINEAMFSSMRTASGGARLVTVASAKQVVHVNQHMLPTLTHTEIVGQSSNFNSNHQRKKHNSLAHLEVMDPASKKKCTVAWLKHSSDESPSSDLPSFRSFKFLFDSQLRAGHHIIAAVLRQLANRLKIIIPKSERSIQPQSQLTAKLFVDFPYPDISENSSEDPDFSPSTSSSQDTQSELECDSISGSPHSTFSQSDVDSASIDSPPSSQSDFLPISLSPQSSQSDSPPVIPDSPLIASFPARSWYFTNEDVQKPKDLKKKEWIRLLSSVFMHLIASNETEATRFCDQSIRFENVQGSLILLQLNFFNVFCIPLLRTLVGLFETEISIHLRPTVTKLLSSKELHDCFKAVYRDFKLDEEAFTQDHLQSAISLMYIRIAEASFRFVLGGDVLPRLASTIRDHLLDKRRQKKLAEPEQKMKETKIKAPKDTSIMTPLRQRLKNLQNNKS